MKEKNDHTDLSSAEETIRDIKGVVAYLTARGWYITKSTIYRHTQDCKLKRNREGVFNVVDVEKYARKYLKCLDVINENSQAAALLFQKALQKYFDDKAEEIVHFLGSDHSRIEELKAFLRNGTDQYFHLKTAKNPLAKDENCI